MNKDYIVKRFKVLGINEGDNIFVTSSLSRFGHVNGGAHTIVDALMEVVGKNGTIVMPSFNFSIFKDKEIVLDLANTPSEMGAISEDFRHHEDVLRTSNLFHPLCVWGMLTPQILQCDMIDTWGKNSPYGFMEQHNFKVVMLGTDFYSLPFFHYIEQKCKVPYREPIEYDGYVVTNGIKTPQKCRRLRRKYGDGDNNRAFDWMRCNQVKIGTSICRSFNVKDLTEPLSGQLQLNPKYLLSESDLLSPMPTMETFNKMDAIDFLFKEKRDLVSQGFKNSLDYISQFLPLKYHTWKSGEKVETWTVPTGDIDTMYVGEYTLGGFSDYTILLPIHLDHDNMANDNLSGVVTAIEVALRLQRTSDLRYTYKFLFVPETIGTMAYISRFYNMKYVFGVVIDSVGTDNALVVTKTKFPHKANDYIESNTNEFLSNAHLWSGNDERVLECWGIPSVQFSRCPFDEYHTNGDTPAIITEEKLDETVNEVYKFLLRAERDFVPKPTYNGVPCLSAVGLWELDLGIEKMYHLLGYGYTVAEIAKKLDMDFKYVYDFIRKLEKAGYVKR